MMKFIKDFFFNFFGIDNIININIALEKKVNNLSKSNLALKKKLDISNKQLDILKDENNLVSDEKVLKEYWDGKYTNESIIYTGRSLPYTDTPCDIPLNVLITPNDPFIMEDLKVWKIDFGEDYETLIPKLYAKIKMVYYKYEFDRNVWGKNEVWEFPFELRAKGFKKGFDCDSWSHFMVSYYLAAGLPSWRVRVVCGDTKLGGHSTVYVFSMKDKRWHHLNSTYGRMFKTVSEFPLHEDASNGKDNIGISKVWFSFNDKFCWYKFKEDLPIEEGLL